MRSRRSAPIGPFSATAGLTPTATSKSDSLSFPMSAHTENPTVASSTPAQLGYHMPAEWEPHEATWLSWPRPDGISFPDSYEKVVPTLAKMVLALAGSEKVHINVCDAEHETLVRKHLAKSHVKADHVTFFHIPTNEP